MVVRISTFLIREGLVLFLTLCKYKVFILYKQLFFILIFFLVSDIICPTKIVTLLKNKKERQLRANPDARNVFAHPTYYTYICPLIQI
jgi:hypothetical protein